MSAPIVTQAIVLRAIPYGEADRVVTLLGRDVGRVSALARSARKSVRRFGGGLGLGARGEAVLHDRFDAELMVLERFEVTDARLGVGEDIGRMAHAGYAAELVDKLSAPRQADPAVFDWLDGFLALLASDGARVQRLRAFELGLFSRLGLGPTWDACLLCGRTDLDAEVVRFQIDGGGIVCAPCARQGSLIPPPVRRALSQLSTIALVRTEEETLPSDVAVACRNIVLELIALHVPGQLKSLQFIQKMTGL